MTSKGSFLSPDRNRHPHAKASLTTGERTRSQRLRRDLAAGDMLQHLEHCAAAPPHNKEGLDRLLAGVPEAAAPDSINTLSALLGESKQGRDTLVEHANGLALRKGNWKYVAAPVAGKKGGKTDTSKAPGIAALYDLSADIGETKNLIDDQPKIAAELSAQLEKIRSSGRSR